MFWSALKRHLATRMYRALKRIEQEELQQNNKKRLALLKRCGRGVGLWGPMHITGLGQIELGSNVHIGANAFIRAEGGLVVGDNTHISRNLVLYTVNHRTDGDRVPYDEEYVKKPVTIGRNVWVGMNVCIAPGTEIGDGAIIGMGTVVSGKVPPMAIVVGSKWRVVATRDREHYRSCEGARRYGGPDGVPFLPNEATADPMEFGAHEESGGDCDAPSPESRHHPSRD